MTNKEVDMIKSKFSLEEYDTTLKVLGVLQNEYSPGMVGYSSICNTVEALSHYIQNHRFAEDVKDVKDVKDHQHRT